MKNVNSGLDENSERQPIGDYFAGNNPIFSSINEQIKREKRIAEDKLAREMYESGWEYEF